MTVPLQSVAQFLWIGDWLSPIERLALESFRHHGWRAVLYTYGETQNVPDGIEIADAEEIMSKREIFANSFAEAPGTTFTTFANIFRLELLARCGGWWFDIDMVAVKGPERYFSLDDIYVGSTWELQWRQCAINCAMYAPPRHPVMVALRDEAKVLAKKPDLKFGETGPFLLQRTFSDRNMSDRIAPFWEFCPYPWRQIRVTCFHSHAELVVNSARLVKHVVRESFDPNFKAGFVRPGTTAVHLHNEIWRRAGISKTGPFHRASFVGRAMRQHHISIDDARLSSVPGE